ncbi:hypothetical protein [Paenibacillus sp. UNC451MF]|uniref:hypothetical protein n=1 Tax=Paenibacillus sp. UNC451MF TaxID=1449063 RepID=UPI00048F8018|nr:hypothetical protein [Paenibacillus sp. UNC451MF]
MARQVSKVPYGYVPDDERKGKRGSVWVYDSFERFDERQLAALVSMAEDKTMAKLVFYPLHEETLRRMGEREAAPYYQRMEDLELKLEQLDSGLDITVERFEGKRKKYTPMDTAFRYLADKYAAPHFVWVTLEMANKLAAFDSFEAWIKKVRLWIDMPPGGVKPSELHPRLQTADSRWDAVE